MRPNQTTTTMNYNAYRRHVALLWFPMLPMCIIASPDGRILSYGTTMNFVMSLIASYIAKIL